MGKGDCWTALSLQVSSLSRHAIKPTTMRNQTTNMHKIHKVRSDGLPVPHSTGMEVAGMEPNSSSLPPSPISGSVAEQPPPRDRQQHTNSTARTSSCDRPKRNTRGQPKLSYSPSPFAISPTDMVECPKPQKEKPQGSGKERPTEHVKTNEA